MRVQAIRGLCVNLTYESNTIRLEFENKYLEMAAKRLFDAFGRIPNPDHEEIIKELKK